MASPILLIFALLICTSTLPLVVHCSGGVGGGFSIGLTHRDSPASPYYNSSLSPSDRLRAAACRSFARARSIRAQTIAATTATANNDSSRPPMVSEVFPGSDVYEYLMTLSIGTPPLDIVAVADTGSDLIWTQCQPCTNCYRQNDPIFDSRSSSTYDTVPCSSNSCNGLPAESTGCAPGSGLCQYHYTYGDKSYTDGILSLETLTFDSDGGSGRKVPIPNMLFGCSYASGGKFTASEGGLVGLGRGQLSLISQLGSSIDQKFSYCLVPHSDQTSASLLNFGAQAEVTGSNVLTVPILDGDIDTFYYLSLEDISVGGEKLGTGQANIIIDSGTTLTMLDDSMMRPLIEKVSQVINYPQVTDADGLFDLCYDVSGVSGDLELPEVTFQFGGGAAVKLPPANAFISADGFVCLAIVSSRDIKIGIFGNIAQQNWHIGYDLGARELSMAPAQCAQLHELQRPSQSGAGFSEIGCRVSCGCFVWAVALLYVYVLLVGF